MKKGPLNKPCKSSSITCLITRNQYNKKKVKKKTCIVTFQVNYIIRQNVLFLRNRSPLKRVFYINFIYSFSKQ